MKHSIVILAAAAALSAIGFANPLVEYRFVGEVVIDDQPANTFDIAVPENHLRIMDFPGGLRLELASPRGRPPKGESPQTYIRLLKQTGDAYRILHEGRTGSVSTSRSFAYRLCDGDLTYMSPAPATVPACDEAIAAIR